MIDYRQITSEAECKGKTIDRIVEVHNNTYFIFTDNTFCAYNCGFYENEIDIVAASGNWGLLQLGFITQSEYEQMELAEKLKSEERIRKSDIRNLKRLLEKYPEFLTKNM